MILRRALILVLAVLLAALGGNSSYLAYWRSQDASLAPGAIAADPILRVRHFEKIAERPDQLAAQAGAVAKNALAALRAEPLQAIAMRQLGMVAALPRGGTGAKHFLLAERITRREITTQLLLIEQTVRDDDIPATLDHYDRILLVYSASGQHLFPVLAKALPDLDVRAGLAKYIARPWVLDFLSNAIDLGGDPDSVTELLADLKTRIPPTERDELNTAVIRQLLARGHFALADKLARPLHGKGEGSIDHIAMNTATSDPRLAQLAWNFVNGDAIEAALDPSDRLSVRVSSEKTGMVAERMTLLAPGAYQFTQAVGYEPGAPRAKLQWLVRCLNGASSSVIWQQALPVTPGQTTYRSAITVPRSCEAQNWQLIATADETQFASVANISDLELVRQ